MTDGDVALLVLAARQVHEDCEWCDPLDDVDPYLCSLGDALAPWDHLTEADLVMASRGDGATPGMP